MFINDPDQLSRRAFLARSGQLALLGSAGSYALGLAGLGEAAAFSANGDYKALVCVFLYGGNDHMNTVVPYDDSNHSKYVGIRQSIAIKRSSLSNTVLMPGNDQKLTDDLTFALNPSLPKLSARFRDRSLAVLLNVGPLEAPITRAQYETGNTRSYPRPRKLFSHNDQQATWQASGVASNATGWGGRLSDLAQSANSNAMFTAINASGNAVFLTGGQSFPFRISTRGPELVNAIEAGRLYRSPPASEALKRVMTVHHQHILEQDYASIMLRSLKYAPFVDEILSNTQSFGNFDASTPLAAQLQIVAKLIRARASMGVARQIFFVSIGGFDHHSNLLGAHEELLSQLDGALDSFYQATKSMGIADNVTTFTASDFGRTFTPNGNGSDHGWGGHHFILGGAVEGGQFFGTAPRISTKSDDQVGRGRLLPTTSVDEYAATLGQWFGVSQSELPSVLPNIGRFGRSDLGFMKKAPDS